MGLPNSLSISFVRINFVCKITSMMHQGQNHAERQSSPNSNSNCIALLC